MPCLGGISLILGFTLIISNLIAWQDEKRYDPAAREVEKREIEALFRRINKEALASRASSLQDGVRCSVPAFEYDRGKRSSVMGGMNYHIDILFEDGVVWLARVRRFNATSPPPALRDDIFQSEFATMKFLEKVAMPTPKVFDFALESDSNPVGVGYMLVEKMAGKSLRWPLGPSEQKRKVVEQLADIFIELQKHPFQKMGCLYTPGSRRIGAFARESLTDFDGSHMSSLGPYSTLQEYHVSSIKLVMNLIVREEMYHQNPIDAYLIHRVLLDLVPSVLPSHSTGGQQNFFLKHADDKGDHILVDGDYNITAIIDWERAHTAPEAIAFNSPIALLRVNHFYDGLNTLGEEENFLAEIFDKKHEPSLANAVREGRLQHRFTFCCGYDLADWKGFLSLFKGLRHAVQIDQELWWEEWKKMALERYQGDDGLKHLLSKA